MELGQRAQCPGTADAGVEVSAIALAEVARPTESPDLLVMPDLAQPHYGFYHTVDSALEILASLGISAPRVKIHMAGPGWEPRRVVDQSPPPGTVLQQSIGITLD